MRLVILLTLALLTLARSTQRRHKRGFGRLKSHKKSSRSNFNRTLLNRYQSMSSKMKKLSRRAGRPEYRFKYKARYVHKNVSNLFIPQGDKWYSFGFTFWFHFWFQVLERFSITTASWYIKGHCDS